MIKKIKIWFKNKENIIDLLVILSFFIIIFTTLRINLYIGLYLLALILLFIAFILSHGGR
ncbi:hypothetical protein CLL_A0943 [Clostridium botulinum B str. Eklund 17B (NRP)]|uniref:Uncharacterized protein n=1 Tax=Clostridium botulinum (strain Eklund 17B / Type B) TaxID=935198 RepID=B2TMF6_CLOBB|nr:hypothetical protein CLL_A0943 [Clostridium botulinum B str. Eklund 17B (NRP)]CDH89867.1 hypothetical protein CB17B0878 [Clostridium botulinum B str. Eklund 17B (NRP)]